ncbi:MAG: DNA cytosine methyltransferase [Bacteroidia bacterium]
MRYFSTFSGIGGFELGIQNAYDHITPTCIGYSEIDSIASSIYQYHWPDLINYGDIRTINPTHLPDFDLLVGGFPCQAFSIAGKQKGFSDRRGVLFFEITRIIREKQPRYVLLENVKGLLSHDKGQTFTTILISLDELGYDIQWQVLNSKNFDIPQNRQRVYIMGHHRSQPRPQVFPLGQTETIYHSTRTIEERVCASTLTARQFASWNGNYIKVNPDTIRCLTPLECERLQGFPDGWTAKGVKDDKEIIISDTKRYKTLGNAVTVNVIARIMRVFLGVV